jgi:hypothetical protein
MLHLRGTLLNREMCKGLLTHLPFIRGQDSILDPPPKKRRTSLILIKQGDRVFLQKKTIINEVKRLCHKGFWDSSTKKRSEIPG